MITLRYNFGRMVAVFDTEEDLLQWSKSYAPVANAYMYTLHGQNLPTNYEQYLMDI